MTQAVSHRASIVIPTYNNVDLLRSCITSIEDTTDLSPGATEIIVSANGCTDGTRDYLNELSAKLRAGLTVVWSEKPLGYSGATNAGIQVARGDAIILLNNDVIILPHPRDAWVADLVDNLAKPNVGIVGPLSLHSGETGREFIVFFCAAIRREVFEKIGTLNEMFGVGFGEDMEFCWRAEEAGFKLGLVGGDRGFDHNQMLHTTSFPIYHKGSQTVGDYDGGRIVRENQARLKALVQSRKPLPKL